MADAEAKDVDPRTGEMQTEAEKIEATLRVHRRAANIRLGIAGVLVLVVCVLTFWPRSAAPPRPTIDGQSPQRVWMDRHSEIDDLFGNPAAAMFGRGGPALPPSLVGVDDAMMAKLDAHWAVLESVIYDLGRLTDIDFEFVQASDTLREQLGDSTADTLEAFASATDDFEFRNFATIALADAKRSWQADDPTTAIDRIELAMKLGRLGAIQRNGSLRAAGSKALAYTLRTLELWLDDGLVIDRARAGAIATWLRAERSVFLNPAGHEVPETITRVIDRLDAIATAAD